MVTNRKVYKPGISEKSMAEKELTEQEKKENMRKTQLEILKSDNLRGLYVSAITLDKTQWGENGKASTLNLYFKGLESLAYGDKQVGNLYGSYHLKNAKESLEKGKDPREHGVFNSQDFNDYVIGFYQSGLDYIKVKDLLELNGIKEEIIAQIHEGNISKEDMGMYMGDYKSKNEKMYNQLIGAYLSSLSYAKVGESFINSAQDIGKNLETILLKAPKENKGEGK